MKRLTVQIPQQPAFSYPICIQQGLLKKLPAWLPDIRQYEQVVIITDHRVKKHYGQQLLRLLKDYGCQTHLLAFPAGEQSKTPEIKLYLEQQLLRRRCNRNTLCLALGGGVVGDMAGFVAATYMRGIAYIQLPTTLLAMVDSSVGGKTAIDTAYGKNLIGAFWQPKAVIADLACLNTLSKKQLINGLVEALKMFLTSDLASFEYATLHLTKLLAGDCKTLQAIVHRAVSIKAAVVRQDEREQHLRMVLNFGHTIGHALEQVSDYKILHGYAVGYGILVEAKIAEILGYLSASDYQIIADTFAQLGITGAALKKLAVNQVIKATITDKKVKAGKARYVLLNQLGQVYVKRNTYVQPVADQIVKQAFLAVSRG